ncbi:hypothetical protein Q2K19_10575 [Micromonospora soli]|uniref:hypothetical protein n=1 Tax=Micromonospora sp. NBRC 110009 TaxID=3061627 RepID=UPI0026724319|nr:hypothetical protein [Micromonospora sp. NBRC 110009]WKU00882.1 hypothetical protein Q2K19_10575 [Micromonospora sp. NBRC 110009]
MPRDYRHGQPAWASAPAPAMTTAEVAALARVLARLCVEGEGDWRGRRDDLLGELRARLPQGHPARTGDENTATQAARAAGDRLAETYGCRVLSSSHHRRVRIRLIPTDPTA